MATERQHTKNCNSVLAASPEYLGSRDCNCDGYHTFEELYNHRITLYIALCQKVAHDSAYGFVWRSRFHGDGSSYPGWFVMGIGKQAGEQITYHLPSDRWDDCDFAVTLATAPPFDGHTPDDVLERLKKL